MGKKVNMGSDGCIRTFKRCNTFWFNKDSNLIKIMIPNNPGCGHNRVFT